MNPGLRLCTTSHTQPAASIPRDSLPFPSVAASMLHPTTTAFARQNHLPFPFPLSHPENGGTRRTPSGSKEGTPAGDALATEDVIFNVLSAFDELQQGVTSLADVLDPYQFPDEAGDRPFAA
ncbi:MAG: hypothetical protein H7210_04890 [Pyrinomonadaceae bacterium]|nr:hypothetical protein [Phycisphaerales bacterium]